MNKKFNFTTFTPNGTGAKVFDTDYLDQMKEELLGKIVLEGKTIDWAYLIPGVKNRISLNGIGDIAEVADAKCGWEATDGIELTQKELIVYPKEIKNDICPKDLEKTYLGMYMKSNKEVPFVGVIAEQYVKVAKKAVEKLIWQGDGNNMAGIYNEADGDSNVVDASALVDAAATWIDAVNIMVANTPAEVLERTDGVLVMGYADFMAYVQELQSVANMTVSFNDPSNMSFYIPGTNILCRATAGMDGLAAPTKGRNMILTYEENIVVGTDMMSDDEVLDFWYSRDSDTVKAHISFKIGSTYRWSEYLVKGYAI